MLNKQFLNTSINFSIILFFILTSAVFSQQPVIPQISVTGTSVIKVTPDLLKWSVSVQDDEDDLSKAKRLNDISTAKVLNLLRELNIDQNAVQTSGIQIVKRKNPYSNEKKFTITNYIWFTINIIGMYAEITSKLIMIDNVYIDNIYLDYSKIIETRVQARKDALDVAKKKAEEMAAVYGITIGKPLLIKEDSYNTYYPNPFNSVSYNYNNTNNLTTFSEGSINVEAKVSVTFELK